MFSLSVATRGNPAHAKKIGVMLAGYGVSNTVYAPSLAVKSLPADTALIAIALSGPGATFADDARLTPSLLFSAYADIIKQLVHRDTGPAPHIAVLGNSLGGLLALGTTLELQKTHGITADYIAENSAPLRTLGNWMPGKITGACRTGLHKILAIAHKIGPKTANAVLWASTHIPGVKQGIGLWLHRTLYNHSGTPEQRKALIDNLADASTRNALVSIGRDFLPALETTLQERYGGQPQDSGNITLSLPASARVISTAGDRVFHYSQAQQFGGMLVAGSRANTQVQAGKGPHSEDTPRALEHFKELPHWRV